MLGDRASPADDADLENYEFVARNSTYQSVEVWLVDRAESRQRFRRSVVYKARHLIESFFAKLKQYRAIATRYGKTARNFLSAIRLAASVV